MELLKSGGLAQKLEQLFGDHDRELSRLREALAEKDERLAKLTAELGRVRGHRDRLETLAVERGREIERLREAPGPRPPLIRGLCVHLAGDRSIHIDADGSISVSE